VPADRWPPNETISSTLIPARWLSRLRQPPAAVGIVLTGASPFFAQPEMGSVRFRLQTIGRQPLPSAARVRPSAHSARRLPPSLPCAPPAIGSDWEGTRGAASGDAAHFTLHSRHLCALCTFSVQAVSRRDRYVVRVGVVLGAQFLLILHFQSTPKRAKARHSAQGIAHYLAKRYNAALAPRLGDSHRAKREVATCVVARA